MPHADHPWIHPHTTSIFTVRFPAQFEDAEIADMYSALSQWWPGVDRNIVSIIDYSKCHRADAWDRRSDAYRNYVSRVAPYAREHLIGGCVVVRDILMQSAVRALLAGSTERRSTFNKFFQDPEEALRWAGELVTAHATQGSAKTSGLRSA